MSQIRSKSHDLTMSSVFFPGFQWDSHLYMLFSIEYSEKDIHDIQDIRKYTQFQEIGSTFIFSTETGHLLKEFKIKKTFVLKL